MDEKKTQGKRNRERSQTRASNRRARSRSPIETWNRKNTWKSANAFINFMQDFRKLNPDVKSPHTFKLAGEKWRNMSVAEKQPFVDAANAVKRQNQKSEEKQKKSTVTPASKKVVLPKASNQKKLQSKENQINEPKFQDPSEGSDSAASSAAKTNKTATSGDESGDD